MAGAYRYAAPWQLTRKAQQLLGVKVDGIWGPATQAAYENASSGVRVRIDSMLGAENLSVYSVRRVTNSVAEGAKPSDIGIGQTADVGSVNQTASVVTTPAQTQVTSGSKAQNQSNPAPVAYTGWRGRLASAARLVGVPESTIASLINQAARETGGRLNRHEHSSSYSNNWLRREIRVFRQWTDAALDDLRAQGEEVFFNTMYGTRLGNRGMASGDGYRYRGRGALQLTGRDNYLKVGKVIGVDLVNDPDWVTRSEDNAIAASLGYLKLRGKLHAQLTPAEMSKIVNPNLKMA